MLYGLTLPEYNEVSHLEGKGNFAVKKYYQFPYKYFYLKKLKMIVDALGKWKIYRNILDFGCGEAKIFKNELYKYALSVTCADKLNDINYTWKFDVIVCASVIEFLPIKVAAQILKNILKPGGKIIISSPMQTKLSRFYFWLIQDANQRYSQDEILEGFEEMGFKVKEYKEWLGLYFCTVLEMK